MKKSKSKQRLKKPGKPAHSVASRKGFRQAAPNLEQAAREFEAGNYPAALQILQQIVTADPKNLQALWYCGLIAYRLGNIDKAVIIVQK